MSKSERYRRFKKEEEEWKFQRKCPPIEPTYTWEDMYYVQFRGEMFSVVLAILVVVAFAIGLQLGVHVKLN